MPFGEYVRETGLAIPLVCLFFGAIWLLPLITALVAGDIVAAEDHNGTLKTILTRSVDRWQVFTGKLLAALTYTLGVLATTWASAMVVGGLRVRLRAADDAVGHDGRRRPRAVPDRRRHARRTRCR